MKRIPLVSDVQKVVSTARVNFVGKFYNKLRRRASGVRRPVKDKGEAPKQDTKQKRTVRISIPWFRYGLVLALFGIIVIILLGVTKYFSVQPQFSELDWGMQRTTLVGSETNVLLVGYQDSGQYSFIDFMALVSISHGDSSHKVLSLNPDFSTQLSGVGQLRYRNFFSNSAISGFSPIETLQEAIEWMLGIRIDRYIAVNINDAAAVLDAIGLRITTVDAVNDPDAGVFETDQVLEGEQIVKYLAADSEGLDTRTWRQSEIMKQILSSGINWYSMISIVLNSEVLVDALETNLSREEALGIVTAVISESGVDTSTLRTYDAFLIEDTFGEMYQPDRASVDQRVRQLFTRVEVIKEQARIEVYNGTKTAGLASVNKRLIENLGGNVVRAANSPDLQDQTKLYVDHPEDYLLNVTMIRQILGDQVVVIEDPYPYQHAAELVLVLGSDLVENQN